MLNFIKKHIKNIKKSLFFSYFLLILLILLPNAITMPSLSFKSAIITAVGLDDNNGEMEVSVLTLSDISKDNADETAKVISGKGKSLARAINNVEFRVGRKLKMGHVGYIVVSKKIAQNNIANLLNNLIITTKLPNTVSLIMCNGEAKNVLSTANKLEQSSPFKLREIIQNEFNENYTKATSVDSFLKGYFSETKTSTIGFVELSSNPNQGINSAEESGGQQSNSSGSANTQQTKTLQKQSIVFKKEHAVFKEGKFMYLLSTEEMKGINWVIENDLQQLLTINNVTTQKLKNADLSFEVISLNIQPHILYRNNKPIVTFNIKIHLRPTEIIQNSNIQVSLKELYIDDVINQNINNTIKKSISTTINKLRAEKTDVMEIYTLLNENNHKNFENFLELLSDKTDFLSYVNFRINVEPKIIED